jgi:hypothetical protein
MRLISCLLAKADAWSTTILVDELNTLADQYVSDQRERGGISCIPTDLDIRNGIAMKTGGRCQVSDSPI